MLTSTKPPAGSSVPPPPGARGSRKRRVLRIAASVGATLAVVAAGTTYWALDRYVIDHVEISDVAAYEAQVTGTTSATYAENAVEVTVSTTATATQTAAVAESSAGAAVVTATSYVRDDLAIEITKNVVGSGAEQVTYYVADVTVASGTQLRAGFANNEFGTNIVADTSDIAAAYGAVFAINGDYYGFRESGIVIRNGVLYRDDGARTGLAIYAAGTMKIYDETTTSGEELLAAGVYNTLSFGPALLDDGEIVAGIEDYEVDTNVGNHSIQGNQPRTGIGIVDQNHFVFVVVDGRSSGYSVGVTSTEFAQIFQDLGATVAYNLDGGGSSTMYFNGELVNNPLGKGNERGTSDIVYLA